MKDCELKRLRLQRKELEKLSKREKQLSLEKQKIREAKQEIFKSKHGGLLKIGKLFGNTAKGVGNAGIKHMNNMADEYAKESKKKTKKRNNEWG